MSKSQDGKKPGGKPPREEWFKHPKACRPGGPNGAFEHRFDCIWKDCCARFQMGFPEQPNVRSVRGIVMANSMEIVFPKRR